MENTIAPLKQLKQSRWWVFQQERFPVFKYGLLIAIFSGSAISYSALLRRVSGDAIAWAVAFVSVFCFFLQIRIADEFKDYEEDLRYRPDRPVPSGLVTLKELGRIGVFTALLQLTLALWFSPKLVLILALVWAYFGLMCCEFFVRDWLKAHPVIYVASHQVILPLIALYATACDWLAVGQVPSIAWFLITCLCNGTVMEIGRKIRAPEDEQAGVQTYSVLWGKRTAIIVWLGGMICTTIAAIFAAQRIDFAETTSLILLTLLSVAAVISYRFLQAPSTQSAQWIDRMVGLWTLTLYFSLGLLPLLLHQL
jgi:4-hydroxybenzoate polyprenyltransferase